MSQSQYICLKDFPNLGLEYGDYFPYYKFTDEAISNALLKGYIIEEEDYLSQFKIK